MTRTSILIGAGVFVGVVILGLAAIVSFLTLNDGPDERDRGSSESARRADRPESRIAGEPTVAPGAHVERGVPGDTGGQAEQEVRLVGIVPSPRIVRLDTPGDWHQLTVHGYYSDRSQSELDDDARSAISYSSSEPSVVQVDDSGVVTGLAMGGADIEVRYEDYAATVPVFVWGQMQAVPPFDPERVLEVSEDGSAIILNRVMVELEPSYDAGDAEEVAAAIGGQVIFAFRTFPGYLVEFDSRNADDLDEGVNLVGADSRVATVFPDIVLSTTQGAGDTGRSIRSSIETLRMSDEHSQAYLNAGMAEAWGTLFLAGPDSFDPVSIAVIDSGFAQLSRDPAIAATLEREFDYSRISVRDAVYLSGEGFAPQGVKNDNHGTGVVSVMVARNNPRGKTVPHESFSGVIASVDSIDYSVTVYEVGNAAAGASITAALEDIEQFKQQVDVVNVSYGIWCRWQRQKCRDTLDAFHQRWRRLMMDMPSTTFVFGAGNEARDAEGFLPARLSRTLPNAITVGGTAGDARWPNSNFGDSITLAAPAEDVINVNLKHGYAFADGTSVSAPLVSGTVALLKALNSSMTPQDIKALLIATAQKTEVCTSNRNPCPPDDRETWQILNAGEAVSSLIWPSVDAEIDLPTDHVVEGIADQTVELTVPVVNTGTRNWNFYLGGKATMISGNRSHSFDLNAVQNMVEPGKSHPFKLRFSHYQAGEWTLELKLYRNPELTSSPDAATLAVRLAPSDTTPTPAEQQPVEAPTQQPTAVFPLRPQPNWETHSFVSVSAGYAHSCGVKTDRSVACWGSDQDGQASPPAGSFVSVSAGYAHNCGVKTDRSVACWGRDQDGQASPPAGSFVSVSAGYNQTCGVRTDSTVVCWGNSEYGRLAAPPGTFDSVSAGADHSCGVKTDSSVACWGRDQDGKASPPAGSFVSVSAGYNHSCGVRTDSTVACWGYNDQGQATPPDVRFVSVSAGPGLTCGVKTDRSVACWGSDQDGPASPPAGSFVSVSAGYDHSCGVQTDGFVACWGDSWSGANTLGHFIALSSGRDETCGLEPTGSVVCWGRRIYQFDHYPGLLASISVGGNDSMHACGVQTDGLVACWGSNDNGQTDPPGGRFVAVSAGGDHTCGIRSDKSVACWGDDRFRDAAPPERQFAQLDSGAEFTCGVKVGGTVACWGDDRKGNTAPPVGYFSMVSAGWAHACGIRTSGVVDCWGDDDDGQATPPGGQFILVNAGYDHTCGIRTDGFAVCWGRNDDGEATAPEGEFLSLSAGSSHTCGLQSDGTTLCWGDNYYGQASPPNWSFPQHPDPPIPFAEGDTREAVEVNPVPYTSLSAGGFHVCGIQIDRSMECWGSNDQGQATPPAVPFVSVSSGLEHTCGVGIDGWVYCWGIFGAFCPTYLSSRSAQAANTHAA